MWNDEEVTSVLKKMVDYYGYEIFSDSRRCISFINDMLLNHNREKKILVMLVREGIFEVISKYPYSTSEELDINMNKMDAFMKEYAIDDNIRDSVVKSFGKILSSDSIDDNRFEINEQTEEYKSIRELLAESEELLIVVKDTWRNDYCFVVDEIGSDGFAHGKVYLNGSEYGSNSEGGRTRRFKVYRGPSQNLIIATHRKNFDKTKDTTLVQFWKNRGFKIVDERDKKINGWLFVSGEKKELEPYMEMVKENFNVNGRYEPYYRALDGAGWGTISNK